MMTAVLRSSRSVGHTTGRSVANHWQVICESVNEVGGPLAVLPEICAFWHTRSTTKKSPACASRALDVFY